MPSGAKKRRAEKRKKEKEASRINSTGSQDRIIHDQRKSYGDSASSFSSMDSATSVTAKATEIFPDKASYCPGNATVDSVKDVVLKSNEGMEGQVMSEKTSVVIDVSGPESIENEQNEGKVESKSLESNVDKHTELFSDKASCPPRITSLPETSIVVDSVTDVVSKSNEGMETQSKAEKTSMVLDVVRPDSIENEQNEGEVQQFSDPLTDTRKHVENIGNSVDVVSKSSEGMEAQNKAEKTSIVLDVVRPKSIENEQDEGKVQQLSDPLTDTRKLVENIGKSVDVVSKSNKGMEAQNKAEKTSMVLDDVRPKSIGNEQDEGKMQQLSDPLTDTRKLVENIERSEDVVSKSNEGMEAQNKAETTSISLDVVRPKSIENEQDEGKVKQFSYHVTDTIQHVKKIEKSEIPKSFKAKAPAVRKSWLSCCGLLDGGNRTR